MKSLIIGLGFGQAVYKTVLGNLNAEIVTVDLDPSKGADYTDVNDAIRDHKHFTTVNICTPNFTHLKVARQIATFADIVFVEKPGVKCADYWSQLVTDYPKTRFMMVKNNMWRTNIDELRARAFESRTVRIDWINKDRVPNPGTWFTTKELAFGGVSRDLMPHLLSIFMALNPSYTRASEVNRCTKQNWQLSELLQTDYGIVNPNGTYDVDDYCKFEFLNNGRSWELVADWRSNTADKRDIEFHMPDGSITKFELGLCPEEAYQNMIKDAIDNVDNNDYWKLQLHHDLWIHERIENL